MSESEEDREGSSSSSDEDTNTREELDENDVKLQQMRRGAQKRGGQSKIAARFEGLVSYDEMLRKHAFQRMKDGMQKILTLHTAVELSSICGCLGLKVQEKASTSIHFITEYAYESNDLDGERIKHIMNFMWEGALWEYLHSIGHPVHSMRPDPKKTIIEIWEQGGLLGGNPNGFVPHFIAREVKKRNEWIQSADIQDRLEKLRKAQDAAKHAERKVVSDHDYSNILSYFNQMSALRRLEQAVREYLISETEIARSRVDSCNETAKFSRQQLAENEQYYMRIVDTINEQLALTESVCEERIAERYQVESDMQRLHNVLSSYIEVAQSRQNAGSGGGTVQPLRMRELGEAAPGVRALHEQLQRYKQVCDDADDALRGKARAQLAEVDRLNEIAEALQTELEGVSDVCARETARADRAERALFYCQRQLARTEHKQKVTAQEAWFAAQRFANKLTHQQRMARSLKPVLIAALGHSHRSMYTLARAALSTLELADSVELDRVFETACMKRQDQLSFAVRKAELARQAALASAGGVPSRSKKVKVAAKKKSGGDGSSKASAPSGKSSRASTPSEASRPNSRATTPKASASTKSLAAAPSSSTKKKPAKKK